MRSENISFWFHFGRNVAAHRTPVSFPCFCRLIDPEKRERERPAVGLSLEFRSAIFFFIPAIGKCISVFLCRMGTFKVDFGPPGRNIFPGVEYQLKSRRFPW